MSLTHYGEQVPNTHNMQPIEIGESPHPLLLSSQAQTEHPLTTSPDLHAITPSSVAHAAPTAPTAPTVEARSQSCIDKLKIAVFGTRLQMLLMVLFLILIGLVIKFWAIAIQQDNLSLYIVSSIITLLLIMITIYFIMLFTCYSTVEQEEYTRIYANIRQQAAQARLDIDSNFAQHHIGMQAMPRTSLEYIAMVDEEVTERVLTSLKCFRYRCNSSIDASTPDVEVGEKKPKSASNPLAHQVDSSLVADSPTRVVVVEACRGVSCTSCAICLGDYQIEEMVIELKCKHCFHRACLKEWFKRKSSCPLCKDRVF